jgi:hypothetical protein
MPSLTVVLSQVTVYGEAVVDPTLAPSTRKSTRVTLSPDAGLTLALRLTDRFTGLTGAAMVTPGPEQEDMPFMSIDMLFMSIVEHDMPMELLPMELLLMAAGAPIDAVPMPSPPQPPSRAVQPLNTGSDADDSALGNHAVARMRLYVSRA